MNKNDIRERAAKKQRRDLVALWAFFALWCGGVLAAFYWVAIRQSSPVGALIVGPMALLAIYYIWSMIRVTLDDRKFGVVSLTPSTRAALPGEQFKAVLRFHDRAPQLAHIDAELRCLGVTLETRSRMGIVPVENLEWSHLQTFPLRHDRADIVFDIPADARATDLPGERRGESGWQRLRIEPGKALRFHRWELLVTARIKGLDLIRNFPVVVNPVQGAAAPKQAGDTPKTSSPP